MVFLVDNWVYACLDSLNSGLPKLWVLDLKNCSSDLGSGEKRKEGKKEVKFVTLIEERSWSSSHCCRVIFYFLRYVLYKVIVILSVLILGFILRLSTKTVLVSVGNEPVRVTWGRARLCHTQSANLSDTMNVFSSHVGWQHLTAFCIFSLS